MVAGQPAAGGDRPAGTPKPKNPLPIVTGRWQFKKDVDGYLDAHRSHLYVHDIARSESMQITSGDHDEALPAWSPSSSSPPTSPSADPHPRSALLHPRCGGQEK